MLVRVRSATVLGVQAIPVDVEVEAAQGMPHYRLVGLAERAVQEAKTRVAAAIRNIQVTVPSKRVVVNLAPGDLRKEGTGFDLPIALGLLAALEVVTAEALAGVHLVGELALSGQVKPVRGVLPIAIGARRAGARALIVPEANALEAAVVEGLEVLAARHLGEVVAWVKGEGALPLPAAPPRAAEAAPGADLADVAGQDG